MPDQISSQLRLRASPPSAPPGLVTRRAVTERLRRGAAGPVTLVCAGPGSGKTLAVASWLAGADVAGPVAWLTVDDTDNDLRTFWADVLSALAVVDLPTGSVLRELVPAGRFGAPEMLRVRAGLAELPVPAVLVLDDLQQVSDGVVLESLNTVLAQPPPNLRLVLITRADPALRLHRLRVSGELTEIRSQDLQFSRREAAELFGHSGLELADDQLGMLVERTQGWPVGLRLAAMSLSTDNDISTGIARFNGNQRAVAEYLIVEVLDRLPAANREFMLKTSIAERLSASLATALTGRRDSQSMLEAVVAANAFMVSLGGQDTWFRLHPLLRDLLQHRLEVEQPGVTEELHLLAAGWFTAQGEPLPAIRHATLAQDWDQVGRLLSTIALPLVLTPAGPALAAALEPAAMLASRSPMLSTLLAAAVWHYLHRDFDAMHRDSADAAQFLDGAPEDIRVPAEVLLAVTRTVYDRIAAAGTLLPSATALLSVLDRVPRRLVPAAPHYRAIGVGNAGVGHLWRGELVDAEITLTAAAEQNRELGSSLAYLSMQAYLSVLAVIHGRYHHAEQCATAAQEVVDRRGWANEPHVLGLFVTRGMTHLAHHQLDAAADTVAAGLAASTQISDTSCRLVLGITAVGIAAARGDRQAARVAATRLRVERDRVPDLPDLLARWCTVAQANSLLISGAPKEVIDLIETPTGTSGFAATLERVVLAKSHSRSTNHTWSANSWNHYWKPRPRSASATWDPRSIPGSCSRSPRSGRTGTARPCA